MLFELELNDKGKWILRVLEPSRTYLFRLPGLSPDLGPAEFNSPAEGEAAAKLYLPFHSPASVKTPS